MSVSTTSEAVGAKGEHYFVPRRLGHVNLNVVGVQAVSKWLIDVAGLAEAYHKSERAYFHSNGNTYHDIGMAEANVQAPPEPNGWGQGPGLDHIAFELENEADLVNGWNRATLGGVKFEGTESHDVANSLYLFDPDGNGVEIYADVQTDWRSLRTGDVDTKPLGPWKPGDTRPVAESRYPVDPLITRIDRAVFHTKRCASSVTVARDYEAMVEFYSAGLVGLTVLVGGKDAPYAVLAGTTSEPCLTLFRESVGRPAGLHHYGYELTSGDDFATAHERLAARGIDVVADVRWRGRRSMFVPDPNGNLVQFFYDDRPVTDALNELHPDLALFIL